MNAVANTFAKWCATNANRERIGDVAIQAGSCLGYLFSIIDIQSSGGAVNGKKACIPRNADMNQMVDLFKNYVRAHPDRRHLLAANQQPRPGFSCSRRLSPLSAEIPLSSCLNFATGCSSKNGLLQFGAAIRALIDEVELRHAPMMLNFHKAAVLNRQRGASNVVLLTSLGGGVFGNEAEWINAAIRRALIMMSGFGLDVRLVSYGTPSRAILQMAKEFE
jgi:hypothetical protein